MAPNVIREAILARPFAPFTMRLADGRSIPIRQPFQVALTNRRVVVVEPDEDKMSILEPLLILSLEFTKVGKGKKPA